MTNLKQQFQSDARLQQVREALIATDDDYMLIIADLEDESLQKFIRIGQDAMEAAQ